MIDVTSLFEKWNNALQSGKPELVSALYAPDAILVPTMSNQIRHNKAEIEDYFVHFLTHKPIGKIIENNIRIYNDWAVNSGLYTFGFKDGRSVVARFTFVYRQVGGNWLIAEHHSSQMPE